MCCADSAPHRKPTCLPAPPGLDNADADEADAQALATLLQLEAVLIHSGTSGNSAEDGPPAPINYVCRVTDPRARDVIVGITAAAAQEAAGAAGRRLVTVEPINPDELLAGVLTQVGAAMVECWPLFNAPLGAGEAAGHDAYYE